MNVKQKRPCHNIKFGDWCALNMGMILRLGFKTNSEKYARQILPKSVIKCSHYLEKDLIRLFQKALGPTAELVDKCV
jgi:hypothetical protein